MRSSETDINNWKRFVGQYIVETPVKHVKVLIKNQIFKNCRYLFDGTYGDFSKIPILPPTHPLRK